MAYSITIIILLYIKLWLDEDDGRGLNDSGGVVIGPEGLLVLRRAEGFKLHANILLCVTTRLRDSEPRDDK